jgi:hypothetical protein
MPGASIGRLVTLGQLQADIRDQADIVGATTRHGATLITRLINQSIQRFRERLSTEGATHFLVSTSGTLGLGATSPYPFYALDLSGASPVVVRTYAVSLNVDGVVKTLVQVPFTEQGQYGGPLVTGEPMAWSHYQTRKVAIMPSPSTAYPYVAWYLPVLPDLVNDADTYDGVSGWEDYITWDVVCRVILRDQFPEAFAMAQQYRGELWQDIVRSATKVSLAAGGTIGRDNLGERAPWMRRQRSRLPPP